MIFGSATLQTPILPRPIQQTAFMAETSVGFFGDSFSRELLRARSPRSQKLAAKRDSATARLAACRGDLAGLGEGLEAAQVVVDLLVGLGAEEPRQPAGELAARR